MRSEKIFQASDVLSQNNQFYFRLMKNHMLLKDMVPMYKCEANYKPITKNIYCS